MFIIPFRTSLCPFQAVVRRPRTVTCVFHHHLSPRQTSGATAGFSVPLPIKSHAARRLLLIPGYGPFPSATPSVSTLAHSAYHSPKTVYNRNSFWVCQLSKCCGLICQCSYKASSDEPHIWAIDSARNSSLCDRLLPWIAVPPRWPCACSIARATECQCQPEDASHENIPLCSTIASGSDESSTARLVVRCGKKSY